MGWECDGPDHAEARRPWLGIDDLDKSPLAYLKQIHTSVIKGLSFHLMWFVWGWVA